MNSSFSITRRGARDKVKAALANEASAPANAPQVQVKAVVAYLIKMIDELPKEFNAVAVAANGECQDNRTTLHSVVVTGEKLDL